MGKIVGINKPAELHIDGHVVRLIVHAIETEAMADEAVLFSDLSQALSLSTRIRIEGTVYKS